MDEPEVERAVQLELLGSAIDLDDLDGQLTALHALCGAELALGAPGRARGWLAEAERLLAHGRGGVQIRARHAEARERVEAAGPGPVEAVELPTPLPPMTEAELAALRADVERKEAELEVRRAEVEAEVASYRAKVEAIEARHAPPPPEPAAPAPASGSTLMVGQPIAALPDAFAYARDGGPPVPSHARFVLGTMLHRSAGAGSWFALLGLGLVTAMMGGIGSNAWRQGNDFNAAVSVGVAVLAALGGMLAAWRITKSRADARAAQHGEHRTGLYLDGDALLWRVEAGFTLLPRDRVEGARVESKYDSMYKATRRRLAIDYRGASGERRALMGDDGMTLALAPDATAALIERWRAGGPIHD